MCSIEKSLLIILPVFLQEWDKTIWLDEQACNGLRLWLENFESVTLAAVLNPRLHSKEGYKSVELIERRSRLDVFPLPYSYTPLSFMRNYRKTVKLIDSLIGTHQYLSFAIGGFWGDWGSFACLRAFRKKRVYSVWTDRVEHDIILLDAQNKKGIKKIYYFLLAKVSQALNNKAIKKASLGLFHGNDCYNTYSSLLKTSFCVHDIHLSSKYHITKEEVEQKVDGINSGRPLKILYVGRVVPMKGPEDWVEVMKNLISAGIPFEARWAGVGDLKDQITEKIRKQGMDNTIKFIGMVSNREELLNMMKESDLFVFCHKTQESPRCLIEALISGCPIVGYRTPYPVDLVSQFGGGLFVEKNNVEELTDCIINIARDRELRIKLVQEAAQSGSLYSDTIVFKNRSELIKKYL